MYLPYEVYFFTSSALSDAPLLACSILLRYLNEASERLLTMPFLSKTFPRPPVYVLLRLRHIFSAII
jgi:hypothetical protein